MAHISANVFCRDVAYLFFGKKHRDRTKVGGVLLKINLLELYFARALLKGFVLQTRG